MRRNGDDYQWRPNDFSSRTNLRYGLEAEHWLTAFKSASNKTSVSLSETLGFVGIVVSLVFSLLLFIVLVLYEGYQYIAGKEKTVKVEPKAHIRNKLPYRLSPEETRRIYRMANNSFDEADVI